MPAAAPLHNALADLGSAVRGWATGWWHVIHVGALILALALTPSSYSRSMHAALSRHLVSGTLPLLLPFGALSAVLSLVIIRIVVVTATSYGLSQYALEAVIRVLVLELIPLTAALFVALRGTVPSGAELANLRTSGAFGRMQAAGHDPVRVEVMPRVVSGMFAVWMLAAVSSLVAMALAYFTVYGFNAGGFAGFTRTVGKVFEPGVAMIFALKTVLFSFAISLIPVAAFLRGAALDQRTSTELRSLVRLFTAILLIEAGSLAGNYY